MDPLRSGAIFRVPDTSVLRQSPAPRTLRAPDLASASPLLRPQPLKPPLPASAIIGIGDASFVVNVPYMSPEAVSNRLESIFRQSPMPRALSMHSPAPTSPADPIRQAAAAAEYAGISRDSRSAAPAHSPMVPSSSIAQLFPINDTDNLTPSGSAPQPPEQDPLLEAVRSSPPREKDDRLAADSDTSLRTPNKALQTSPKAPSSRQIFKTPEVPSSKSHSSEIALTDWYFKREAAGSRNIIVEGKAPGEAKRWHTSAIDVRLSDRRVRTKSGSIYRLVGPADRETMAGVFPVPLVEAVKDGLPENWQARFDAALAQAVSPKRTEAVKAPAPPDSDDIITIKHRPRTRRLQQHEAQVPQKEQPPPAESEPHPQNQVKAESARPASAAPANEEASGNPPSALDSSAASVIESVEDTAGAEPAAEEAGEANVVETSAPAERAEQDAAENGEGDKGSDRTDDQADEEAAPAPVPAAPARRSSRTASKSEAKSKQTTQKTPKAKKAESIVALRARVATPKTPKGHTPLARSPGSSLIPTPNLPSSRSGRRLTPPLAFWRNEMPRYDAERTLKAIELADSALVPVPVKKRTNPEKPTKEKARKEESKEAPELASSEVKEGAATEKEQPKEKKQEQRDELSAKEAKAKKAKQDKPAEEKKGKTKEKKAPKSKTTKKKGEPKAKKQKEEKKEGEEKANGDATKVATVQLLGRKKRCFLDTDDDWTQVEVDKLYKALSSADLPQTDPLYWGKIAAVVGRSADECFQRFHRAHPTPAKKDKAATIEESPIRLDHGARTNVQRKNIRKALNKAQENHADDVFDQTPLKAQATAMSFSPSLATPDNFPVKGPLQLPPVATTDSPVPDLLRPADHDAAGAYINRLQRLRRTGAAGIEAEPENSSPDKAAEVDASASQANESVLSEGPMEGAEAEDYYFSS